MTQTLALLGGPQAVTSQPPDLFAWPIITPEDEEAVLEVLRTGRMSDTDVTVKFESEFAAWIGSRYALGFHNGTASVHAALFAVGVGVGDEVICPSVTYWASGLQAYSLGASVVFADIDPDSLCIDPEDIARKITPATKAIVVVHYLGHPADMDRIMAVANAAGVKVVEDVSHAQGGLYRSQRLGTIGHVGAMSLMSGKSFAIGEGGILVTDEREVYERAIAFGHYERFDDRVTSPDLAPYAGLPLGGYKFRMHQLSSAVGRVQLKYYDERCAEIRRAMNYFWDQLEGVPGVRAHRVPPNGSSDMAGWYAARGHYLPEQLDGLSVTRFTEAVRAEGVEHCTPGANEPMHQHPLFATADVYGHGRPTRIAHATHDLRLDDDTLPVSDRIGGRLFQIPWFKKYQPDVIDQYAQAFRKVCENHEALLTDDPGDPPHVGSWKLSGAH